MQRAQSWARTQLTHEYHKEYKEFYYQVKKELTSPSKASLASSRAKTLLVQKYPDAYRRLHEKAVTLGYARGHKSKKAK